MMGEEMTHCQSFPRMEVEVDVDAEGGEEGGFLSGERDLNAHNPTNFGLPRSKTDSAIAYPLPEYQEARGASNLIQEDGELNYQALIRAVLVALNERPSPRICDVALSLLDVLLDLLLDVKSTSGGTNASGIGNNNSSVPASSAQVDAELMGVRDRDAGLSTLSLSLPLPLNRLLNKPQSLTLNAPYTNISMAASTSALPTIMPSAGPNPPVITFHDVATHRLLMSCITR